MGDWLLSGGKIKTLNHFFTDEIGRGLTPNKEEIEPEVKVEFHAHSQRFHPKNIIVNKGSKFKQVGEIIRGPNNDTNTEKEKDNRSLPSSPQKVKLHTNHFVPETYEEEKCLKIAMQVGDTQIGFYLNVYRKHGTGVLEDAFDEFEKLDGRHKNNPPAFFNSLVQKRLGKRATTIIPFKEDIIVL
ncbi:hypothetical protein H6778_03605 [Candidatus Nomurabacteria bacterium]|nr:hypothetical protein [Candidatus Nomurabacteria bacterium]